MNFIGLSTRDRELLLNSKGGAFWCENMAAKRLIKRNLCHHLQTNKWSGEKLIMAKGYVMLELYNNPLLNIRSNWFKRVFNSLLKRVGAV